MYIGSWRLYMFHMDEIQCINVMATVFSEKYSLQNTIGNNPKSKSYEM